MSKKWLVVALVVVMALSVVSCGIEDDKPKAVGVSAEPSLETGEGVFFTTGEMVETKKVKAIITGVEKVKGTEFNKPANGNEFVHLIMEIENISDSDISISSLLSFNAYVDDEVISESLSAQIAKEDSKTLDGTIAAGKKLKGTLGYEVPKDWQRLEIHFEPAVFSNTVIKWIIENK